MPRFSRSLIALAAAYLVALQALILPLSLPADAAAHAGGLCITAPEGSAPAGQDHGCPCAAGCGMQCHAPALGAGASAHLPVLRLTIAAVLAPAPLTHPPAPVIRGPQMPRGPPAA
ncbi:MAG: hypothetical protein ACTHLO_05610 [Pseudolabrys sp.]